MDQFADLNSRTFEVDVSPDGRLGLSGTADGDVTIWDMNTGEPVHQLYDEQQIMAVTFSPDGHKALIGAGYLFGEKLESGHVILWDVESGEEIRRFDGHPYAVLDVEFSSDGKLAVSSGAGPMVILWDVETGQELWRFDDYFVNKPYPNYSFWDVEFSPDGQTILAAHADGPIRILDVYTGQEIDQLMGHKDGMPGVVYSADGQKAASGGWDGQAIIWDVPNRSIIHRLTNHVSAVGQVRFSPDSQHLLGGSTDGTASLWDVETGKAVRRYNPGGFIRVPDFYPDGAHAFVGMQGGRLEIWRIDSTLEELLTWTKANRYIPDLTCAQRELYAIEPLCEDVE